MISIGQEMNGYEITAAVAQFRATEPESCTGVVILGLWTGPTQKYVVAEVPADQVNAPYPARHWNSGYYTDDGDKALQRFVYRAGLPVNA